MLSCAFVLILRLLLFQIDKSANQPATTNERAPIHASLFAHIKYHADSHEQRSKEEAIALWIARAALPSRTVENEDFVKMIERIDKRLSIKFLIFVFFGTVKVYLAEKVKYKQRLSMAHKISICLDIWTKKGLTASFLAISACYFNSEENKAEHY